MKKSKWSYLETYLAEIERHFKRKGYKYVDEGAFRVVLSKSNKYVIKVPINEEGISCNLIEELMYKGYNQEENLAQCEIFYFKGIPILKMEYVMHWVDAGIPESKLPKWANKIDHQQVGLNRSGKLVCYDYGNNWDVILSQKLKKNFTTKGW